jgi:hypothetical protein
VGGELDEIDVLCVFKSTADELVITVIFGFVNCRVHSLIPDIFVLVVDLLWTRRKVQLQCQEKRRDCANSQILQKWQFHRRFAYDSAVWWSFCWFVEASYCLWFRY